jgi:hypothetical protein
VPIAVNKGVPITLDSPSHPVSQAVMRFAQQRLLGAPARRPAGRSRGKRRAA